MASAMFNPFHLVSPLIIPNEWSLGTFLEPFLRSWMVFSANSVDWSVGPTLFVMLVLSLVGTLTIRPLRAPPTPASLGPYVSSKDGATVGK